MNIQLTKTFLLATAGIALALLTGIWLMKQQGHEGKVVVDIPDGNFPNSYKEQNRPSDTPLTFLISLDNPKYPSESPLKIEVHGVIQNVSEAALTILKPAIFIKATRLIIKSEEGKVIPWKPLTSPAPPFFRKDFFETIKPGQQISFIETVYDYMLSDKLTKGRYTLQTSYTSFTGSTGDELGLNAWKGTIYSNTVDFEIE